MNFILFGLGCVGSVQIWPGSHLPFAKRYLKDERRKYREQLRSYRMVRYLPRWLSLTVAETDAAGAKGVALAEGVSLLHHF